MTTLWRCPPCRFTAPVGDMERIRKHLRTKKHSRLRFACPRCSSLRLVKLEGETWDGDGIRPALKCQRCKTEYKSYAHGRVEKEPNEYTEELPQHVREQLNLEFEIQARRRGWIKKEECTCSASK